LLLANPRACFSLVCNILRCVFKRLFSNAN